MTRGLLINPYDQTITEVSNASRVWGLDDLNRELGKDPAYSGTFTRVGLGAGVDLWIDDEGLLTEGRPVFECGSGKLCGVGLVISTTPDGNSVGTTLPLEMLAAHIRWTDLESTGHLEPTTSRTEKDGGFVILGGEGIFRKREKKEGEA